MVKYGLALLFGMLLLFFSIPSIHSSEDVPDDPFKLKFKKHQTGNDLRLPVISEDYPYSAIGRVVTERGRCTGTMIGRYFMITNAHCICLNDECDKSAEDVEFYPNYILGQYTLSSRWKAIVMGKPKSKNDFAIIRLKSPLGDRTGWLGVSSKSYETLSSQPWKDKLFYVGYPSDAAKGEVPVMYVRCGITKDFGDVGYGHDCPAAKGSSGSGIAYIKGENYYVTALHWGSTVDGDNDGGVSAPFYEFYEKYKQFKEEHTEQAKTTFHMCNFAIDKDMFAAYAYWDSTDKQWVSRGHYKLKYKQCEEFVIPGNKYSGSIYTFANAGETRWGGNHQFCYNQNDSFHYGKADSCSGTNNSRGFSELKVENDRLNVREFTR